ncbi:MAG: endo-1,4-beta-xylanase [Roseburia sp.]|nr:endo-1,4-beta-xylanase [Roseburia sp.]
MQKKVKGAVAKALAAVLALSLSGVQAPASSAAGNPSLSAKKVTVTVKKSKKVTVKIGKKNAKKKQVKKLTVKSSSKKTAAVKKKGKTAFTITGKKAGTATVTAKVTLKGKKKAKTLKVKVTVKAAAQPTPTPAPTAAPSISPAVSAPAESPAAPVTTPEEDNSPKPKYTAAPNAGVKRIKNTSSIQNPIISNVSIWGLYDNPYAETGYGYTQYGPYSGLFTKWYAPKDSFKALHELFNAETAQSLKSVKPMAREAGASEPLYTVGETGGTVKSIVTTGTLNWDTKELSNTEEHSADFVSRTSEANKDVQKVTVVDGETLETTDGGNEPAVRVSGRANNWHGIQVDITDYLTDPSKDYRISMDILHNTQSQNSLQFYTQIAYLDENGNESDDRPVLVMQSASAGQWKTFAANFSKGATDASRIVLFVNWYGEPAETGYPAQKDHNDFYIKNISVSEIASDQTYDASETLSYSSLYTNTEEKYGFSLGGCIGNANFKDSNYKDVLDKHFSSLTIDNDLKMYALLDQDATIANENGDGMPVLRENGAGEEVVKWAYEHGIGVRGHTIVCDTAMSTNCKYFFHEDYDTSKPLASKEVMLQRLRSFITQTIMYFEEKYPGTIHTWDVVNEAIATAGDEYEKGDARQIQTKDNLFYDAIRSDYVEYSFLYAREAVDNLKALYPDRDVNIKLFYNDFNCFEYKKRNAICALAESIQAFGQSQGKGNLIDGVGMQCYIGSVGKGASNLDAKLLETSTKKTTSSVPNAVFMFHDLGLDVQFTELTIRNYLESENAQQAEYFKAFMQMAIDINNGTITKALE